MFYRWLAGTSTPKSQRRRNTVARRHGWRTLQLEILECRQVLSVAPLWFATPQHVMQTTTGGVAHPLASAGPTGYSPAQIRHAYGFDSISFNGGTVAGDGSGTTIAIVDSFDDPNIANDLKQFDAKFGLPDPVFTKVNQNGGTTYPKADGGWISEIALDVEWAHAIAPKANILLVEASDDSFGNLLTAINYARSAPGVVAISMSWGGSEFSGENSYDSYFTTPSGHGGVVFTASSGDSGAPAIYPAISTNVISVGGTSLSLNGSGNVSSETVWNGSGGGISAYESQPSYQRGVVTQTSSFRANPDVSYDSNPSTGFPVYDSYNNGSSAPWSQFGGTSDAAPQIAALIAIADQGRALAGKGALDGATQALPLIYQASAGDFRDITSGTTSGAPRYSAGPGYDLATGRGTPIANLLVNDLIGQPAPSTASRVLVSAPSTTTAGAAFSITVTALNQSNTTFSAYRGTVHFASADGLAGLPADYTFVAGDNGAHTFSVTLKTAGSQTITAKDTVTGSITGSASVSVSPAAANHLAFGQQPTNVAIGAALSPGVTVRLFDAYNNLLTNDNSDQVTIALGANPGGATLGGATTATVSGGVATFNNILLNKAATGYTLTAKQGALPSITSASFAVTAAAAAGVAEGFENNTTYNVVGGGAASAYLSSIAAHDGAAGLVDTSGNDWIYRNDAAAQVKRGDTISVWLMFSGAANGRAYFGFGASASGTLSLVAAPNTNQLILQDNTGYGYTNLSAVSQSWQANHWYRLEVVWGTSGAIVGRVYDSNGTTLLNSVSGSNNSITSGGFAFRSISNDKYWDTVAITPAVNNFGVSGKTSSSTPSGSQHFSYGELAALDAYFGELGFLGRRRFWW